MELSHLEDRGSGCARITNWGVRQPSIEYESSLCREREMVGDRTEWFGGKRISLARWACDETDFRAVCTIEFIDDIRQYRLAVEFQKLAEHWKRDTAFLSSLQKKVIHPAYQRIIGLGPPAIPHILSDLRRSRGHWLWALNAITGEDPAPSGATFSEAVDAWLKWGEANGHL